MAQPQPQPRPRPQPFATKDTPPGFSMAITEYSYSKEKGPGLVGEIPQTLSELDIIHMSAAIRDKPNWWIKGVK